MLRSRSSSKKKIDLYFTIRVRNDYTTKKQNELKNRENERPDQASQFKHTIQSSSGFPQPHPQASSQTVVCGLQQAPFAEHLQLFPPPQHDD
jgi:hypothetical protein